MGNDRTPRSRIDLYGRELAYLDLPGPGTPFLLVHGIGASLDTWSSVPTILARHRRVIAVDLPGHGLSASGPGDYSLGAHASTLRDLLDQLGVARVHLVGHSLGGGVSMQFAYQYPERVASLTLEASGGLGEETFVALRAAALPGADLVLRALTADRTRSTAGWVSRQLARVGAHPEAISDRALDTLAALAEPGRRSAFLATLRSVVGPAGQRVSALERLQLMDGRRVLIVWGDDDGTIPVSHGRRAHELLPGSRLVVFPRSRHEPHVDDPERFAELVAAHADAYEISLGAAARSDG